MIGEQTYVVDFWLTKQEMLVSQGDIWTTAW